MNPTEKYAFCITQISTLIEKIRHEKSPVTRNSLVSDLLFWWDEKRKWEADLYRETPEGPYGV